MVQIRCLVSTKSDEEPVCSDTSGTLWPIWLARFAPLFAMHIVPHRFIRIRHYGILSNRSKKKALQTARAALGGKVIIEPAKEKATFDPLMPLHYCSCCERTTPHILLAILPPIRAGPTTDLLLKS